MYVRQYLQLEKLSPRATALLQTTSNADLNADIQAIVHDIYLYTTCWKLECHSVPKNRPPARHEIAYGKCGRLAACLNVVYFLLSQCIDRAVVKTRTTEKLVAIVVLAQQLIHIELVPL